MGNSGLYSSMNTMFTFVYDKENDNSWYVCNIHRKSFEETAQITILS